ncbi:MAG: putative nucleotidyltransferase [Polyangiales bacterium]
MHRLVRPPASPQGVQNALDELARSGLVHQERVGRAVVNTLNRQHILAPLIEQVVGLRDVVVRKISEIIRREAPRAVYACLFGSVARGDDSGTSDVDVLIVWPDDVDLDERDVSEISAQVTALTGNACEPFAMSETEYEQIEKTAPALASQLKVDAISLLNGDL